MSTNVLRTADGWWVVRDARAVRIETKAVTTAELLADRAAVASTPCPAPSPPTTRCAGSSRPQASRTSSPRSPAPRGGCGCWTPATG